MRRCWGLGLRPTPELWTVTVQPIIPSVGLPKARRSLEKDARAQRGASSVSDPTPRHAHRSEGGLRSGRPAETHPALPGAVWPSGEACPGSLGRGQPQATSAPPGRIQRSLAIPGPAPLSRNRPPTRGAVLWASDTLDAASGRRSVSTAERGQTGKQQGKEIEPLARRQPRRETEQKGTGGCQGPRVAQGRVAGHRRGLWRHSG